MVHFFASTQPLAAAVSRADRLCATRGAPVAVTASGTAVEISADGVFGAVDATVHEAGVAVVGLRALATVLSGLTASSSSGRLEVELRVDHARLVIETSDARFALPLLGIPVPQRADVPVLGVARGLRDAASVVADATAKDGLPLFTAVRIRSVEDRLTLVATDRFRAAFASVAWTSQGAEVDALVPAASLAAAMRFAGSQVPVRAGGGWFGIDWPGGGAVMPQLALPFPDAQIAALLAVEPIATVEVDADALRGAVDRVTPFALQGILLSVADGAAAVSGWGELGEAREEVKASVAGAGRTMALYQPKYLADAVRAFTGETVTIQLQQGIRPTVFGAGDLRYLVVPLRLPDHERG